MDLTARMGFKEVMVYRFIAINTLKLEKDWLPYATMGLDWHFSPGGEAQWTTFINMTKLASGTRSHYNTSGKYGMGLGAKGKVEGF